MNLHGEIFNELLILTNFQKNNWFFYDNGNNANLLVYTCDLYTFLYVMHQIFKFKNTCLFLKNKA